MADKRNGGYNDDEFDWEEYDMLTSGQSPYKGTSDEPLSRRTRTGAQRGTGGTRRTTTTAQELPEQPQKARRKRSADGRKKSLPKNSVNSEKD